MLAEAMCKLEGFSYSPSDSIYWEHGSSTERDTPGRRERCSWLYVDQAEMASERTKDRVLTLPHDHSTPVTVQLQQRFAKFVGGRGDDDWRLGGSCLRIEASNDERFAIRRRLINPGESERAVVQAFHVAHGTWVGWFIHRVHRNLVGCWG